MCFRCKLSLRSRFLASFYERYAAPLHRAIPRGVCLLFHGSPVRRGAASVLGSPEHNFHVHDHLDVHRHFPLRLLRRICPGPERRDDFLGRKQNPASVYISVGMIPHRLVDARCTCCLVLLFFQAVDSRKGQRNVDSSTFWFVIRCAALVGIMRLLSCDCPSSRLCSCECTTFPRQSFVTPLASHRCGATCRCSTVFQEATHAKLPFPLSSKAPGGF